MSLCDTPAAIAFLEAQKAKARALRGLVDKGNILAEEAQTWIYDDIAVEPTEIPSVIDKD